MNKTKDDAEAVIIPQERHLLKDILKEGLKPMAVSPSYSSPFTRDLDETRINRFLKVPNLEMYDGICDLYDHTYSYECLMLFYGHNGARKCDLFIFTLKKTNR